MTIHTLEKEKHADFLKQERIDPITGDVLQENDEIVICASCKSAFLVDSWEYMDRKHCNQRRTLREIPKNEIITIEKDILVDLKVTSGTMDVYRVTFPLFLLGYIISFVLYYLSIVPDLLSSINLFHGIYFSFVAITSLISPYKNTLKVKSNTLIFDNRENSTNFLKTEEIENIEIYTSKRHRFTNSINRLFFPKKILYTVEITDKNQKKYKVLLQKKELERLKNETTLLQKFGKKSIISVPIQLEIEQNIS